MKSIKQENVEREIIKPYNFQLVLDEPALCLIEIIASAKSWWQNIKSRRAFFKDDDIFLFLDNQELTTSTNAKQDARSAWNGNELKGLEKTVLIAANLSSGKHTIDLKPDQSPYLKSITISQAEKKDNGKINYIPIANNPAKKSPGRPWLSYIILDLLVASLSISARAPRSEKDDDDIKLIINGQIQKNEKKIRHADWYWCGQALKGEDKTFLLTNINSHAKQYNLDLYSDGSPYLYTIGLGYQRIPTVDNPEWTGDFRDDTDEILLARLILGETSDEPREAKVWVAWSVINRTMAGSWWPKSIKEVILQKNQYDPIKPTSPVYKKIINPLNYDGVGVADKKSWYECYEIAQGVISGKINSPTKATHFFGVGVTREWFEKNIVPNGKFLKKIGNTYFYWSPN